MRIKSVSELKEKVINEVQNFRFGRTHMENYRGHGLREYKLIPGLGRYDFKVEELTEKEKCLYNEFIKKVENGKIKDVRLPFKDEDNSDLKNYWYALFQAQHLGLKTRFMDWSINWETALLFAVDEEKHHGKDGSLWIYFCQRENLVNDANISEVVQSSPFEHNKNSMINSPIYMFDNVFDIIGEKRMGRQWGRFWVQPIDKINIPLNEQKEFQPHLKEIIIDGNSKAKIKEELNKIGITLDWKYYRNDDITDERILEINEKCLKE